MTTTMAISSAAVYGANGWGRLDEPLQPCPRYPDWPKWDELFGKVYERFPRLDPLSKAAGVAAELALSSGQSRSGDTALILVTGHGCADADRDYYRTAFGPQPELASPKIFPYTLPSAGLAEICIRHKFQGPSLVFWGSRDLGPALRQMADWIGRGEAEAGLVIFADAAEGVLPEALALRLERAEKAAWRLMMAADPAGAGQASALPPETLAQALADRRLWTQPGWRLEFQGFFKE